MRRASTSDQVREFHRAYGLPVRRDPGHPSIAQERLRWDLLREEVGEYREAYTRGDLVELADALADIVYIAHGTALVYGIDLDAVLDEVHRSNMSKLGPDGRPIYREDGKVLKGPNYTRPNVAAVMGGGS